MERRVLVSAHRMGAGADRGRENSLEALEESLALGVDYVELDVWRRADGSLVVAHDPEHDRGLAYRTVLEALAGRDLAARDAMAKLPQRLVNVRVADRHALDGADEVWAAVLEHRAHLASEGSLEARRAQQQQDWMWALVDDHLEDAVRSAPAVRAQRAQVEAAVRSGELSAVDGAARILGAFGHYAS